MGYVKIYELPKGMYIAEEKISRTLERIAASLIANLARLGLKYEKDQVEIDRLFVGLKFTINSETAESVDPSIFNGCIAQAILENLH